MPDGHSIVNRVDSSHPWPKAERTFYDVAVGRFDDRCGLNGEKQLLQLQLAWSSENVC